MAADTEYILSICGWDTNVKSSTFVMSSNSVHATNNADSLREFVQTAPTMGKYLLKNWLPSGMWGLVVW